MAANNDKPEGIYEQLLFSLFALGAVMLAAVTLLILYDVSARLIGLPTFPHTLATTEYGLYYLTLLGAPWLVRIKRHIYLQLLTALAPGPLRPLLARISYLLCAIVCAGICGYAGQVTIETWLRADQEVRSFDMPRWLIFAVMPVSFALLTLEFGRYLLGFDDMYDGDVGVRE